MTDDRLARYLTDLFAPEDAVLARAREGHEARGLPAINISPDEGSMIRMLLRAVGARRVLELGTLGGYSGVWIARALPKDGRLVTIESDPAHAVYAREVFETAGVTHLVELVEGRGLEVMRSLEPPFDAVFLDADKAPLPLYLAEAHRLLRPGGLLLCDNTFMDGRIHDSESRDPDVVGMRAFNRLVAEDPRYVAAVIPVRDGLLAAVRVAA